MRYFEDELGYIAMEDGDASATLFAPGGKSWPVSVKEVLSDMRAPELFISAEEFEARVAKMNSVKFP